MPQQDRGDKRGYVLICEGPSCGTTHQGQLPGHAHELLDGCAWRTGPCLGMCPVGQTPSSGVSRSRSTRKPTDRRSGHHLVRHR